jgi:hypothetical protein
MKVVIAICSAVFKLYFLGMSFNTPQLRRQLQITVCGGNISKILKRAYRLYQVPSIASVFDILA